MPVHAVLPPTIDRAGGVVVGGKTIEVGHNALSGNPAGKRAKLLAAIQEYLDHRGDGYTPWNTLPIDDPDRRDHADFALPVVTDHLGVTDDGTTTSITVLHPAFIWDDGPPSKEYRVHRKIVAQITLVQETDPTLGGEDRYSLSFRRIE